MTSKMGLSARLMGAFAIVALLIVAMAAVTISIVSGIGKKSHHMSEVQTPLTVDTVALSGDLVGSVSKLREYLLTGEKSAKKAALDSWTAIDTDVEHIRKDLKHTDATELKERVGSALKSIEDLREAQARLLKIAFTPEAAPARQLLESKLEPLFAAALQNFSRMIDAEMKLGSDSDRKLLLKEMTDARGTFANATGHLRASVTTGSKWYSGRFHSDWEEFGQSVTKLESKTHLLTAEQAAFFASFKKAVQEIGDEPKKLIETRQSGNWNVPAKIMREEIRPILEGILDIVDGKTQSNGLRHGGIKDAQLKLLKDESRGVSASIDFLAIAQWTAIAIGLIFCIAIWMFCNRYIVTPIIQLTSVMNALASGDREIDIPMTGRHDEVGDMANALVTFKEQAIEKVRIEAEADKERKLAEAERKRHTDAQNHAIRSVGDALGRLSGGDLTVRVEADVAEEYVKLKSDFNAAVERLETVVSSVVTGADGIMSGTTEIAQAADDLSRRTENQAATLEETAAAVAEITANVSKSAEGANRAQDVVSTSKVEAEKGGEVVGQAIESMADIEQSSKEIGDIIGVIDEIAFQTNLLALNAGVEAARAGEAGRGFAVVASEVRALAQRAATAARQIKELISTSTEQVGRGVELVKATGTALEQIVTGVNEINTLVGEIASSAHEQAGGLQQINTAVNQLDQVTQENAAMVEESTAAARTLANQTEELTTLVGQFSVAQAAGRQTGHTVGHSPSRNARPAREKIVAKQPIERRPMIQEDIPVGAIANGSLNHHAAAVNGHADAGWEEF